MKYLFSLHGNTLITKAELPPLPQYFLNNIQGNAQQGKRVKTEKSHFQSSPLAVTRSMTGCFATQNIGEVARSDGGVKPDNQKNSYAIFSTPLLRNFVPSVSPLYRYATQGRRLNSSRSPHKKCQTMKEKESPFLLYSEKKQESQLLK